MFPRINRALIYTNDSSVFKFTSVPIVGPIVHSEISTDDSKNDCGKNNSGNKDGWMNDGGNNGEITGESSSGVRTSCVSNAIESLKESCQACGTATSKCCVGCRNGCIPGLKKCGQVMLIPPVLVGACLAFVPAFVVFGTCSAVVVGTCGYALECTADIAVGACVPFFWFMECLPCP